MTRWSGSRHRGVLGELAYVLVLIGGIVLVLFSVASFFGMAIALPFHVPLVAMFGSAIIGIVLGIIAFIGSKHVQSLLWAVGLLVIGFIAGGLGGVLVLIGGLLGIVSRFV